MALLEQAIHVFHAAKLRIIRLTANTAAVVFEKIIGSLSSVFTTFALKFSTVISAEHISVSFGARPLFSDVSFVINAKERLALVGKNGAGKSTLLKILAGEQMPTSGTVSRQSELTIGYLPQVMRLADSTTLMEEAEKAFDHIRDTEKQLEHTNFLLGHRSDYNSSEYAQLIERSAWLTERLQMMGSQNRRAQVERTLLGLGFREDDFSRPTAEFSGGWRMRVELAKLLLLRPDLLLLDEPTNHLDIESIAWLEDFLGRHGGALVLVSHDRAFVNNVTTRTLELSCGKLIDYRVKYDQYVQLREQRRAAQLRAWENQQKEMADIREFVERFRYKPTKAVQVQQRLHQLEKMVPIEIDEVDNAMLHLKFPPTERSGDFPLICEGVGKTYGEHNVFHDVNLTIRRGEKVAFVGRNGEGKTTLVKCIMGETDYDGSLRVGHNVKIGYYAQNQAQLLDDTLTVYDTIDHAARGEVRTKIRDILGAFMFGGEASEKRVSVLSGGERSRLAMIRLLLQPVNFLILDEPTNHLDMRTKDVLKEAIQAFDGTVVVVSHDRDFLDGLVNKVYEFGDGKVREHLGGIYDFLEKKKIASLRELEAVKPAPAAPKATGQPSAASLSYEQQKEYRRRLKQAEGQVEQSEQTIAQLEAALRIVEESLSAPQSGADMDLVNKHQSLTKQLEEAMAQWDQWSEMLETLKSEK